MDPVQRPAPGPDPCFAALLADPRNQLRPPSPRSSIAALRAALEAPMLAVPARPVHAVEDLRVDQAANPVPLRLYRPNGRGKLPVILFFHGGGFVIGSLDTHDAICRELALASGAAVVAVDYRRAPECPFPAPLQDCCAALGWLALNAAPLGLDARRIGLCGDSAGANLAVATALRVRERGAGVGPVIRHLGLLYPLIDPLCDSESAQLFAEGYLLTRKIVQWFWSCYLGAPRSGGQSERTGWPDHLAALMRAAPAGLPAATILTAEFDPLRDEGEAFAGHLRAAGVPVVCRRYAGMLHGFVSMPSLTPAAGRAIADLAGDLAASLDVAAAPIASPQGR